MKTTVLLASLLLAGLALVFSGAADLPRPEGLGLPGESARAADVFYAYVPFFRIDFSCLNVTEIPLEECRALVDLYYTTGGEDWAAHDNWMENYSPGTWLGVTVSEGTVISLTLSANNITGTLPANLADLAGLREVDLSGNPLSGGLEALLGGEALPHLQKIDIHDTLFTGNVPLGIVNLAEVEYFHFDGSGLCEPDTTEYQAWKATVADYLGTGEMCSFCSVYFPSDPSICEALVALYESTGGENWTNNTGWLEDPDLVNWHGVSPGGDGSYVYGIDLSGNNLVGTLPPEIGNLHGLVQLYLSDNQITGTIPAEIGVLDDCAFLYLDHNQLSGSIPPELGDMGYLWFLQLDHNQLSGEIPVELEQLTYINIIGLSNNQLTGSIPPGLFPEGAGQLNVSFNPLMSGSVPMSFIEKTMYMFHFNETGICEPGTPEYLAWKATVPDYLGTGVTCAK